MNKTKAPFDIVLFGATGFTGKLIAEYLARREGRKPRWALAGRTLRKLEQLRDRLVRIDARLADLPLLVADASDPASLRDMVVSTRLVISAVGPYIRHGEPLVAACVDAGVDYVDLSGEPEFVDLMWLRYHDRARISGARIVNCCGFDSIPHDLGAYFTVRQLPEGVPIRLEGFVRVGGRLSGGTLSSTATAFSRWRETRAVHRERRHREGRPVDRVIGSTHGRLRYEKCLRSWVVPAPNIDPQIVLRSAAADERYGSEFRYGHYLQAKNMAMLASLAGGVGALAVGSQIGVLRRRLVALSGRDMGPNEDERAQSWFSVRFIGCGGGRKVHTEVSGGDPGYGESAKMIAEAALCLAFDRIPRQPGVQTPAHAMGQPLIRRLKANGIQFRVLESLS